MEPILIVILVVVSILNIALFFKIWQMTNNVKQKHDPFDATVTFEKKED